MASAKHDQFYFSRAGKLHFFCPLCHYHQSTNTIERMQLKHHLQLLILTAATLYLSFPIFGWKGIGLYFLFLAGFEFFYRLRKRHALICQSCGFDPFLYKQDVRKARAALKQHWENRIAQENLFAGVKLKNYKTSLVNEEPAAASPSEASNAIEKSDGPTL